MVVSIIIPAYNSEKFIRRCLDSVVNQIYKNIEIIVVDDASTDNTEKIIKEYAEKDNRIRPFYSSENKGVSFSRNIGLKASTGEYIMFVDSDDELTKDAVRRMVDIANKYNSDYVDSYQIIKYAKNNKEYMFTEFKLPKKHLVLGSIENNPKIINMYMYIKGKLIKKNLINDLLFDESLKIYEDLVFEQTIKSKVRNYVMINKPIYVYYEREDSLVNSLGKKHECYLQASKLVKEIYKNYDINIKNIVESMLFQNGILTLFTKVIKNNDTLDNNFILSKNYIKELIDLFPNYNENKNINIFIKKFVIKISDDDKELKKYIRKFSKKNYINLYFKYLSVKNKYSIKNPLD